MNLPQRNVEHRTTPAVFDASKAYYRTIIENNLFRPLGWTPPRPVEPYRLIGALDANVPQKLFSKRPQETIKPIL